MAIYHFDKLTLVFRALTGALFTSLTFANVNIETCMHFIYKHLVQSSRLECAKHVLLRQ